MLNFQIVMKILCMVPTSPGKSWNLKRVLESPGILLKFWKNPGKVLEFLCCEKERFQSKSPKERFLNKHQHFSDFVCMLHSAVHWLTAVIFIWGILDAIMSIYSHHWLTIFKLQLKAKFLNCGIAILTRVQ